MKAPRTHTGLNNTRIILALLSIFVLLSVSGGTTSRTRAQNLSAQDVGSFLSVALPASAEVRVENRRGGVRVEVWDEPFVGIAYSGGADKPAKARRNSPVQIDRSDNLLSVTVARSLAPARQTPVELNIRLPRAARAKISTSEGVIEMRGVPASVSAQTVSGDIRLDVSQTADADITAHSLNGTVLFEGGSNAPPQARQVDRAKFQTRLGAGTSVARLFSGRGTIRVSVAPAQVATPPVERVSEAAREQASRERRPPVLEDSTPSRPPAGVPDSHPKDSPQEVDEDEVVRVDTELVTVNTSVVDRAGGRALTGLTQNDFRLYEDGTEQRIEHFEAANAPFDLVLLIDLSGSTGRVTDLIRAAAMRFFDAARPQDRIAVITFAGETRVVSPLTTDREALRAAVRSMQPPQGHTRLYDAGAAALEFIERQNTKRRRAVILMSDGLDSTLPNVTGVGSTLPFEELRSRVQEFDGLFYSIWTSTEYEAFSPLDIQPETFDLAANRMEQLAETGGGLFYEVEKLDDLAGAYERVVEDLGTVYSLSYRPTNRTRDGRWRAIRIRIPAHPQAVARGKRGYNAN